MNTSKIKGPIFLELKRGCKNDAVIGGFDKFMLQEIKSSDIEDKIKNTLAFLFESYKALDEVERKEVIDKTIDLLNIKSEEPEKKIEEKVSLSSLFTPVQYVKGIGPKLSKVLEKINIQTCYDLLYYFPRDYIDLRNIKKIAFVSSGENVVLKVRIVRTEEVRARIKLFKAVVTDGTGYATCVWFNQPYLKGTLKEGMNMIVHGKIQFSYGKWEMPSPEYELLQEGKETLHSLRIVPVYRLTEGISQKNLRLKIKSVVDDYAARVIDYIDKSVKEKYQFLNLSDALSSIHFPDDFASLNKAKDRLVFDELFEIQLLLGTRKREIKKHRGIVFKASDKDIEEFEAKLSFSLTKDQKKAMKEIIEDVTSGKPMNRLLHGDVGSGKTVVSFFAIYLSVKNGFQSAMMSPTEILAQQTYEVAGNFLSKFDINIALLTSSTAQKERKRILKELEEGKIHAIFGTHALIEEAVKFKRLGMVIVDEQHRFGVLQRAGLREKAEFPHTLVMSATPIPRTLALTLYGDLDISQIREMPKGRKPVITKVFFENDSEAYSLLLDELGRGNRGYIVCPLIEEGELELVSVTKRSEELKETYLQNYEVGILHGQMSGTEKERIMQDFKSGKLQVLVSTTVVEVGVDVKDATVIVIEDADRFGLATLHQLRGRVGRSALQSYCFLISRNPSEEAIERLRVLEKTNDGFEVSEEDLRLRGPGEILGTRQHGLPEFKLTTLLTEKDLKLLEIARAEALKLINGEVSWSKESLKELNDIMEKKLKENFSLVEVA